MMSIRVQRPLKSIGGRGRPALSAATADGMPRRAHKIDRAAFALDANPDWQRCHTKIARAGHPGQAYRTSLALAEWLCRTADRIDPAGMCGPRHCLGRGPPAPNS